VAQSRGAKQATPTGPGRGRLVRLALVGGFLAVGLLGGLLLENIFRGGGIVGPAKQVATRSGKAPGADRFFPAPSETKRPGASQPAYVPPWLARPEDSKNAPPHHIPAWKVGSGPPEQKEPPKLPPLPPDPTTFDPSTAPPKGVDGDRPPRPVPGLE
jgi:hypothetical protein